MSTATTTLDARRPVNASATGTVTCTGLTVCYGTTTALDAIDLTCNAGEILVLLGPSGCGKTTLLRCIAGLEPPVAGTITLDGNDITGVGPERRGIAMVFQDYALYPQKSVFGNIEFPLRMSRVPSAERRRRVAEVAELLRLESLLDRKPSQLSGGQQQRVGIGRALVRNPRVLLMDEPLSNLDAELRGRMRADLRTLQRHLGTTTVYVTHDQSEALSLADRLVVLRDGHIEQVGTPDEVYRTPASRFVASLVGGMSFLPASTFDSRVNHQSGMLGVRGEDLRPGSGGPNDITLTGTTRLTELVGRDRLVHIDVDGTAVTARLHADIPISDRVTVHVPHHDLHHFDADGYRIATRPRTEAAP